MADDWRPGMPEDKFGIERWGHNSGWERCAFTDLRVGDVHRYFNHDGEPMHPLTYEVEPADRHTTAICMGTPFKNMGLDTANWCGEPVGYCVEIDVMQKEFAQ